MLGVDCTREHACALQLRNNKNYTEQLCISKDSQTVLHNTAINNKLLRRTKFNKKANMHCTSNAFAAAIS